jgi:PhnB protein
MIISAYLSFNGNCDEAFKFYEKCLGAKIVASIPYEGTPAGKDAPADWQKKILHVRLVKGEQVLMGSDAPPGHFQKPQGVSVCISVDKAEEAEKIFKALSEKASEMHMPLQETFWAERFGMFVDRYGIAWMINCEGKKH